MKDIVLLSGGIDSTTCLAIAADKHGVDNVIALNMFYGQRHAREIESAHAVADFYGVPYIEMDLSPMYADCACPLLEHSERGIDHRAYADQLADMGGTGTVTTYVPFRNGLFLSVAAVKAMALGADTVYCGAHADDAAGRAYPDCTPEFAEAMGQAVYEGTAGRVCLAFPLLDMNKTAIVSEGLTLGAPYHLTWSCYEGGDAPCGVCGTCRDRAAAFAANNAHDPALT